MTKIKKAFNDLIDTIAEETLTKLKALEATVEERRLARLAQDLETLKNKQSE